MIVPRFVDEKTYKNLPAIERALLLAAEMCALKVRETGANRGYWVERFLAVVGLGPGYSWCAAFVTWCLVTAGVPKSKLPKNPQLVVNWKNWAKENGYLTSKPTRGCLFFFMHTALTGHIGWFIAFNASGHWFNTIEGNTNDKKSREGDGVHRLNREDDAKTQFIDIPKFLKDIKAA